LIWLAECVWNLMAHGDAREGKWRGNWRMEWVASTLTLPRNVVYPALLPLMRTTRLPAVDWTDTPANLNGLVRFSERRNLVSARVPSRFKRSLLGYEPTRARCTYALKQALCAAWSDNSLEKPCSIITVPDGTQTCILNILGVQKERTQICMSDWSQSFTSTQNVDWGFLLRVTLPACEVTNQPH